MREDSRALTKAMREWMERTGVYAASIIQGRTAVGSKAERPRRPGQLLALGLGSRVDSSNADQAAERADVWGRGSLCPDGNSIQQPA